jgi:hypothetical protein
MAAAPTTRLLTTHLAQQNRNPGITSGTLIRTVECESSLRRRSQIHRCIRFIESGLRQVHWWYGRSTKDSCQKEQNQHPTASLHGHVTPNAGKGTPTRHRMSNGDSPNLLVFFLFFAPSAFRISPLSKTMCCHGR